MQQSIPNGQRTQIIYNLIKEQKYMQAIQHLSYELQFCPKSRAFSLLGYCYYQQQDYSNATKIYEQLVRFYPNVDDYKMFYAQCQYKDGQYDESLKSCQLLTDNNKYRNPLIILQIGIRYERDEIQNAKTLIQQGNPDDADLIVNEGCILFKEKKYSEALSKFQDAINQLGYNCELAYNIALCHYKRNELGQVLKYIAEIIEKGVREHPELGVGSNAEGIDVRSVGNTQALKETALIEAFNLKAALEYQLKNYASAKEALIDMPPREENQLDPVTLMNHALINMENDATGGFKKLNFLLQNPPYPPETLANILLLYCKYEYYEIAADILAENADETFKYINQEDYEYIEALTISVQDPEEAFRRFEDLCNIRIDTLRKLTKEIQDARVNNDGEAIKVCLKQFDETLENYIPALMAQAKILWNKKNYNDVEKLFRQSAEFCADHEIWQMNFAHVLFIKEQYDEAIKLYEQCMKRSQDNLLDLTAIVIANFCVSLIMTSSNEFAEEWMRKLEAEEERVSYQEPDKPIYHLCIVNLVIGTLYCAKGNHIFGLSRIIKSLEPYDKKLGTDTWYYAKRCFMQVFENMAKQMLVLPDESINEQLHFFDIAEEYGKDIKTTLGPIEENDSEKMTVSKEARLMKRMILQLKTE